MSATQINRPASQTSSLLLVNIAQILRSRNLERSRCKRLRLVLVLVLAVDRSITATTMSERDHLIAGERDDTSALTISRLPA